MAYALPTRPGRWFPGAVAGEKACPVEDVCCCPVAAFRDVVIASIVIAITIESSILDIWI